MCGVFASASAARLFVRFEFWLVDTWDFDFGFSLGKTAIVFFAVATSCKDHGYGEKAGGNPEPPSRSCSHGYTPFQ